jgi:hypothetical protein
LLQTTKIYHKKDNSFIFNFDYRDAGVIAIGHFVWAILSVLFVFSLLGVAHEKQSINLDNLKNSQHATSITGKGFWLIGVTLAESALAGMDYNWLWSGLLFTLMV